MPLTFNPNKTYTEKQKAFKKAAYQGKLDIVKSLIKLPEVFDEALFYYALKNSFDNGEFHTFKFILQNSEVDPSLDNNELILSCIDDYHYDYAVLLLKDPRVDSSLHDFFLINNANAYEFDDAHQIIKRIRAQL